MEFSSLTFQPSKGSLKCTPFEVSEYQGIQGACVGVSAQRSPHRDSIIGLRTFFTQKVHSFTSNFVRFSVEIGFHKLAKITFPGFVLCGFMLLTVGARAPYGKVEEIRFDILNGDENVGRLVAQQEILGQHVVMKVNSEIEVRRLFTLTIGIQGSIEYHGGRLISSDNRTEVNGYTKTETSVRWKKDHYWMDVDGDEKVMSDNILYSGSMMYFVEPEFFGTVFSEKEGSFDPVLRQGEGRYVVEKNDGARHTFTYYNGQLQSIEYPHSLMDVTVRRQSQY